MSAPLKEDPFLFFLDSFNRKSPDLKKDRSPTSDYERKRQNEINERFYDVDLKFIKLSLLDKMASYQKNAIHSLWKIEAKDNFHSEDIKWETPYRFRHFISGKYLRLKTDYIYENKGKCDKPVVDE